MLGTHGMLKNSCVNDIKVICLFIAFLMIVFLTVRCYLEELKSIGDN